MQITYDFRLASDLQRRFSVDLDREPGATGHGRFWTRLDYHQCQHCPLSAAETPHCPAALDTEAIVADFGELLSYETTTVTVTHGERTIGATCDVQTALSSLMGLIMATSGCPILSRLKALARIHLPFQSIDETHFRLLGAYCVGQLIAIEEGRQPDWSLDGLQRLIEDVVGVNQAFMHRLQAAARQDATFNALAMLAAGALNVQFSLERPLAELKRFAVE